jgi:hypothetical protein
MDNCEVSTWLRGAGDTSAGDDVLVLPLDLGGAILGFGSNTCFNRGRVLSLRGFGDYGSYAHSLLTGEYPKWLVHGHHVLFIPRRLYTYIKNKW